MTAAGIGITIDDKPIHANRWYFTLRSSLNRSRSWDSMTVDERDMEAGEGVLGCPTVNWVGVKTWSYTMNTYSKLANDQTSLGADFTPLKQMASLNGSNSLPRIYATRSDAIGSAKSHSRILPTHVVMVADYFHDATGFTAYQTTHSVDFDETSASAITAAAGGQTSFRHQNARNIVFLDGHVNPKQQGDVTYVLTCVTP
jgi:prepilin-type processing-associated H-X9-DG protein